MKIKGKDWMDWLHQVRRENQKKRRTSRHSLAKYLKQLEGKRSLTGKEPPKLPRAVQR